MACDDKTSEQRYQKLFDELDRDSDGKIDVDDLVVLLNKKPVINKQTSRNRAKEFIRKGSKDDSNLNLNFAEFLQYMVDHEKRLDLHFKRIDQDKDNAISYKELHDYFEKLDVKISEKESKLLVEKINKNGSLMIGPNEWKEYFFLVNIDNFDDLLYHWRYSTSIYIGDSDTYISRREMWYNNLIAGACAGSVSRTFTAPFDRLKTVMQALGSRKEIRIVGGFQFLIAEGGITGLWRGNGINVIKIAPEAALKFAFYEELKILFRGRDSGREATIGERFVSGSAAGCMAQSVIYPLEVLKTRLVLRKTGEYSSVFDCIGKIIKREGYRAFYKGYLPNVLGIIPYAGTDLAVYETLKRFYMKRHNMDEVPSIPILLMCGTTSSIIGQLVSYPLALIRTRLQAQEVPMNYAQKDTMTKLMRNIWEHEGVRGLYRGLIPNIIKVVPAVSISYVVYEKMKKRLRDRERERN